MYKRTREGVGWGEVRKALGFSTQRLNYKKRPFSTLAVPASPQYACRVLISRLLLIASYTSLTHTGNSARAKCILHQINSVHTQSPSRGSNRQ